MFRLYRLGYAPEKGIPKNYHYIREDPSYNFCFDALISKKESFTFDEIINCLKKSFLHADYLGCCSVIYWEYYKEFYDWIIESFEQNNIQNIKTIKKFYKKTLIRWVDFVKHSDDTMYPQNEYFRLMKKEIEKHLQ